MGVQARVRLHAVDRETAAEAARAAFARIAAWEQVLSDYRVDSEVSRLAARAGDGTWVAASPMLLEALRRSRRIADLTDGAFDPVLGALTKQWRETRRTGVLPDEAARADALARAGWDVLEVDEAGGRVRLTVAGASLDFGGIGKGLAAEDAVDVLRALGFPRCLVAMAGDVACGDPPPGTTGWSVSAGGTGAAPPARLLVANAAVSTSGDVEQVVEIDGRRSSHLIDPRTGLGMPVRRAVSVLAPRAGDADALASALFVLGPEAAERVLARWPGAAARFELRDASGATRTQVIDPTDAWNPIAVP